MNRLEPTDCTTASNNFKASSYLGRRASAVARRRRQTAIGCIRGWAAPAPSIRRGR